MSGSLDFDKAALGRYLDAAFGAGRLEVERISGGQSNPTYFVNHGTARMVLRKKPVGPILPGAHAIEREYRVLGALHPAGVPVARPILIEEDDGVLGTPFYLMERVEGRVFEDCALPDLPVAERRGIWMGLADALARMHAVRPAEVGLEDYGKPGNYFGRQLARWTRQWHESDSEPIPQIDRLVEWLPENMPEDDGMVRLAHGDFRMGNMLFHPTEPRVVAILDWELSTLGHPLADVGFCAMPWHSAPDEYGGLLGLDLAAEGIPTQAEFVARYRAGAPDVAPLLPFHEVFALFRFAVIFVGIADRARAGSAAGEDADRLAPLARRFAVRALEIVEGGGHHV
ncbi:phosphotransferase family protein [Psychromarinibacter halotolerans]|uniref:Phosphotransferase family protein n=1 Tax=Psychromarinibacter halotolerans TaxID=1775175 RepID=A0ABV7GRB6_9RHOB|nr:phosphotransferase family protein [Psychromarinibacter halotolerans]MDF0595219.1 phosphotransferase family protein [Psychromarinibacter halotolerans]